MGMHASAEVFYGIAWPGEELPKKWTDEQEVRWEANDYEGDDEDYTERMEDLLKTLGFDNLLEVDIHGYEWDALAVKARGSGQQVGCGDVQILPGLPAVSLEAKQALYALQEHLGEEPTGGSWLVTVSYG